MRINIAEKDISGIENENKNVHQEWKRTKLKKKGKTGIKKKCELIHHNRYFFN